MVTLSPLRILESQERRRDGHESRIADHAVHHAFIVVGESSLFGSHLTQHCIGEHSYQFIVEFEFVEPSDREALEAHRRARPDERCFIANTRSDPVFGHLHDNPLTLPQIAASPGAVLDFDVHFGMPNPPGADWPWAGRRAADLYRRPVRMKRIVYFRPFVETIRPPDALHYLVFGADGEAHVANLQFRYPDFDHVATLEKAPGWLSEEALRAGAIVQLPDAPRAAPKGSPLRCDPPLRDGVGVRGKLNGAGESHWLQVRKTQWFSAKIPNIGPEPLLCPSGA